ncbi:hypothetical protein WR25_14544 [Diploscapter pachys]|uniref:UDENN domain-containing protein n=1 Tax=Diploscapter pachys TaxID=2018661 RepID=A0A2A2L539_9BILA|nr:hypothetical protein WR25_14544 [Diploscapter pachys]
MSASTMVISSRHRSDVATLFDVFCEIGAPSSLDDLPVILSKYPEDYNDESFLKSARQFSFPCDMSTESDAVQMFCFALTDQNSQYTFGFVRYTPRSNTCLCMLSGFYWPNIFYKILNQLSLIMNNASQEDLDGLLTRIYHTDIPNIGDKLHFESYGGRHPFDIVVPDLRKLPTLKDDRYMLEFYNAINPRQMLALYASLLKERRIIFTGRRLSQLSSCIQAAATLLFPMYWQSIFIPVLPHRLLEMVQAPMPFLIGVPKQVMQSSEIKELGDVAVVDFEEKTFTSAHDDLASLPVEVLNYLKSQLKGSLDMGDSLSRTFLRANVMLFGDYRTGFSRNESTGVISWDKEKFIREQRPSFQPFLQILFGSEGVQYLERFIADRLRLLNQGGAITDEFEAEITNMKGANLQNSELINGIYETITDAKDMFQSLKGKVSGMQISSKLNKLAPKEVKSKVAEKARSIKRPRQGFEPMSFENAQWEENDYTGSDDEVPQIEQARGPEVGNLIDFDTPLEELNHSSSSAVFLDQSMQSNASYHTPPSSLPNSTSKLPQNLQNVYPQIQPLDLTPTLTHSSSTPDPFYVQKTSQSNSRYQNLQEMGQRTQGATTNATNLAPSVPSETQPPRPPPRPQQWEKFD